MKKLILLALSVIAPLMAFSMKIVTNEIDEFTGERTVITSWESFDKTRVHIRFRLQNGKRFLDLKYRSGEAIVIAQDSPLMLKSTQGDISKFLPISMFAGGEGDGAVGLNGSGVWGIHAIYTGDIEWFLSETAILLRIYATDVYIDKKLSEKEGKKLSDLCQLFFSVIPQ